MTPVTAHALAPSPVAPSGTAARPVAGGTVAPGRHHGLALRSPWYECIRKGFDRFDPRAHAPVIQKYDNDDIVRAVVTDCRDSLAWTEDDEWSVAVGRTVAASDTGRMRFASHRFARMGTRKLFQPSHQRFYAVTVEVFCDEPGLPRPAPKDGFSMGLVMRRQTLSLNVDERRVRRLARDVLAHKSDPRQGAEATLDRFLASSGRQAWMTDGRGGQAWVAIDDDGQPIPDREHTADEALDLTETLTEQVLPMWRIPPMKGGCDAAATRSLWFALVPTFSSEHEVAFDPALPVTTTPGTPKLDSQASYELLCRATRPPPREQPHCPPEVYWSGPSETFKLAAFLDPEGTAKRTVSITMPDLRSLAARAGASAGPGGVSITTPAGSQLSFDPDNGTPSGGTGPGGAAARTCTFALELFMIVAFFVFSLFLPVVVFLFQLWWLLLLRFCLPPTATAVAVLTAHFGANKSIADLPAVAAQPTDGSPRPADLQQLDEMLGGAGLALRLHATGKFPPGEAKAMVAALADHAVVTSPGHLDLPDDPLCALPERV